ncbi:MAG: restriction endonuclease subunit S [Ruminococcus sp.]|nr:restriction endonuclease subunit S [Ruminococcus sp.]
MIDTKALRSRILDLAIQGKLTDQLPSDGTAEELYQQIQAEKQALINEGKIKKEKPLPEISTDEIPFEIPSNWKIIRLADISMVISKGTTPRGGKVSYLESGIGFLRAENLMGFDKIDTSNLKFIDEETHLGYLKRSVLESGDILISIAGTLGRTGIVHEEDLPLNTNQAIAFIRLCKKDLCCLEYIAFMLNTAFVQKALGFKKVDMAIPNLSLNVISNILLPLPPLAEQKRIVERVEKIFRLLDTIDEAQEKYSADSQILKAKLITAGIQGKLTKQLPSDGTAEELYQQIQAEKQKLIKEGKLKKEKPLPPVSPEEVPFEILENWMWVHLGEIFQHNTGKALNSANNDGQLLEYITTSNVYWDRFELDSLKQMYFSDTEIEKCTIRKGDLLMCEGGDIGRSAIWNFDFEMRIQNHLHRLRGYIPDICQKYYYYLMWLYKDKGMIDGRGIGLQGFSSKRVHELVVPLPPLAEQKRIADVLERALGEIE